MIDYNTIKTLAAQNGLTVADLCALAPKNDPFYTGRPSEETAAQWFADIYHKFGYTTGVHLRRIHYRIVSQETAILRPDGQPYQNTQKDWDYLNEASKWARYLGLVPAAYFVDRRNPDAIIYAKWQQPGDWMFEDPAPGYRVERDLEENYEIGLYLPYLPDLPDLPSSPDFTVEGYESIEQAYHLEIWCEKTTMNDVLGEICQRYGCNLITGAGEMSITSVVEFIKRVETANRPARIFYISDYDPAGLGMPISVARKIEFFQRNEGFDDLDIRLHPICLTMDQVSNYKLPRVPVKDSDKRKANFEAVHGEGQVELDALEALYPGELERIVTEAVLGYYDSTLPSRARQEKRRLVSDLDDIREAVLDEHDIALSEIVQSYSNLIAEYSDIQARYKEATEHFYGEIDRIESLATEIFSDIRATHNAIEANLTDRAEDDIDLTDYPLPSPDLPDEDEDVLYISGRSYTEQLEKYKFYRDGLQ
jgi:hypothetical protein